ncbi:MAG TPA: TraB/GumN family protein [Steroidobacteraceae bacterium]|nr:TraB/GumN family protein [Steroidobacteraceae bacterium]HRX88655.1 TraB/GumN family protein [Steroidobacteraceae bacterium]
MKPITARTGLLLVTATLLSSQLAQADSAVWSLQGEHNTVYIAGSVHALPAHDAELPRSIERAYADAETLVMELDMDDLDPAEAATFMLQRGTLPADQTLAGVLSAAQYAAAVQAAEQLGLPPAILDRLEPWVVTLVLTQAALAKSGYDPMLGVDQQLAARARADGKEITGLETLSEQLSLFDDQDYQTQAKFLELSSDDIGAAQTELAALLNGWRNGRLDALEAELRREFAGAPELYRALLSQRNANWVPKILALRQGTDDYLVLVGALHLVGPDGLIALLEQRGVKLSRLQ